MEIKTEALVTDRSTPPSSAHRHPASGRIAKDEAGRMARSSEPAVPPVDAESSRPWAGEPALLDDRLRGLAEAIAVKGAATSGLRDGAEAHEQAHLTGSQIRSQARTAWSAQAHISAQSALALLRD